MNTSFDTCLINQRKAGGLKKQYILKKLRKICKNLGHNSLKLHDLYIYEFILQIYYIGLYYLRIRSGIPLQRLIVFFFCRIIYSIIAWCTYSKIPNKGAKTIRVFHDGERPSSSHYITLQIV